MKTARSLRGSAADSSDNFTLTAHEQLAEPVTLHALLVTCLAENDRRMGRYEARLLRPRLVPGIARALHRLLPASV